MGRFFGTRINIDDKRRHVIPHHAFLNYLDREFCNVSVPGPDPGSAGRRSLSPMFMG